MLVKPSGAARKLLLPGGWTATGVVWHSSCMMICAQVNLRQALLDFLESAYQAGAKLADWDIEAMVVPPLAEL